MISRVSTEVRSRTWSVYSRRLADAQGWYAVLGLLRDNGDA